MPAWGVASSMIIGTSCKLAPAWGLFHTHRDGTIYDLDQKFIFTNGNDDPINATDNIMSYNRIRRSTWHWQWKIIKRNAR